MEGAENHRLHERLAVALGDAWETDIASRASRLDRARAMAVADAPPGVTVSVTPAAAQAGVPRGARTFMRGGHPASCVRDTSISARRTPGPVGRRESQQSRYTLVIGRSASGLNLQPLGMSLLEVAGSSASH